MILLNSLSRKLLKGFESGVRTVTDSKLKELMAEESDIQSRRAKAKGQLDTMEKAQEIFRELSLDIVQVRDEDLDENFAVKRRKGENGERFRDDGDDEEEEKEDEDEEEEEEEEEEDEAKGASSTPAAATPSHLHGGTAAPAATST